MVMQGSPKPDAEDGRYDADSASSHEKPVQNGSEQRTSPSVDSSCSSSAVSPPELTKDGGTSVRFHNTSCLVDVDYVLGL